MRDVILDDVTSLDSNRETLAFALGKLRHHRDRAGCLCGLYPRHPGYDPETISTRRSSGRAARPVARPACRAGTEA